MAEIDAAGNVIKSYGYRPGSTWTTDPLFMKVGGNYYFYQNDHLGTPQKLTAVNGAVVWSAKYFSFGYADVAFSSTITNNLRLPGQYFDVETGLHFNWFRYYDPIAGRYCRLDPLGLAGGDINLYAYVWNNAVNYLDPSGEAPDIPGVTYNEDTKEWEHDPLEVARNLCAENCEEYKELCRQIELYDALTDPSLRFQIMTEIVSMVAPLFMGVPMVELSVPKAKVWTKRARIKRAKLPTQTKGKIRYVPPKNWHPSEPLPRGPRGGYMDKFGNEWTKGPSRTKGQPFEWDVQRPDGTHWNISLDGKVTH